MAVALDASGYVYVTDTWNQRVQVFAPVAGGLNYAAIAEWPVNGWYGGSLQNKPFITVDGRGNISFTDPEACRVLTFSSAGKPLHVWDGCSTGAFQLPSGIVADGAGGLWVSDAESGKLVHFKVGNP